MHMRQKRYESEKSHADHNCSHASTRITNHYTYAIEKQIIGKADDEIGLVSIILAFISG